MKVYLVRHGLANVLGINGAGYDADRMLSDKGIVKTKKAADGLKALDLKPQRIISSPLIRAVQTAQIIAEKTAPDIRPEEQKFLIPAANPSLALSWLARQQEEEIVLVGHSPHLSLLASLAMSGSLALDVFLKKASALCLDFSCPVRKSSASLLWLLQPKQLRLIGKSTDT